jgi:hypothetical protein
MANHASTRTTQCYDRGARNSASRVWRPWARRTTIDARLAAFKDHFSAPVIFGVALVGE